MQIYGRVSLAVLPWAVAKIFLKTYTITCYLSVFSVTNAKLLCTGLDVVLPGQGTLLGWHSSCAEENINIVAV